MARFYALSKKEETLSKRFTDTEKWSHQWYRLLKPKHKCAWQFVVDACDFAGIWIVDFGAMSFFVGEEISEDEFNEIFKTKVEKVASDKYFIKGFPVFQYADKQGKLSLKNQVVLNALEVLKKFGIDLSEDIAPLGGHPCPGTGVKEEDKEKEKVKEKEKENPKSAEKTLKTVKETPAAMSVRLFDEVLEAGAHGLKGYLKSLPETEARALDKLRASKILNCSNDFDAAQLKRDLKTICSEVMNSS